MLETRFTRLIGCAVPVQLAGMGGLADPALPAVVSEAGGLGMLGAAGVPADVLAGLLNDLHAQTLGPFGVSFLMPFLDPASVPVAATRARVVELFYGAPEPALVEEVHAHGALAGWQVGSREEALAAADAGCDLVVAQGSNPADTCAAPSGSCRCWTRCCQPCRSPWWPPAGSAAAHPACRPAGGGGRAGRGPDHRLFGELPGRAAPRAALGDRGRAGVRG